MCDVGIHGCFGPKTRWCQANPTQPPAPLALPGSESKMMLHDVTKKKSCVTLKSEKCLGEKVWFRLRSIEAMNWAWCLMLTWNLLASQPLPVAQDPDLTCTCGDNKIRQNRDDAGT